MCKYFSKSLGHGADFVFQSDTMGQVFELARLSARTDGVVLLRGETGTGKDVLARFIHNESDRAREIFIPVNCAALSKDLIESELFGYVYGSFTGAKKEGKPGLFELADSGTLFLDEIGEMPMSLQSKLLRVIETGEVTRLGGTHSKKTNSRIIASTNRDLSEMIKEQTFREDLYYRLNFLPITIPPLRERVEDIEALLNYYLDIYNTKYRQNKMFSKRCIDALKSYPWPGNVRELRNVVHRLILICPSDIIDESLCDLKNSLSGSSKLHDKKVPFKGDLKTAIKEYEKLYINSILTECEGNVTKASKILGVHRSFIYRKIGIQNQQCPVKDLHKGTKGPVLDFLVNHQH